MTFDFQNYLGPVPAHRHQNPDGSEGGWVADSAKVESTCFIGPDAWVFGEAQVFGDAWVYGEALVFGEAQVFGDTWVYGGTEATGDAKLDSGYFKNQIIWGKEKEKSWRFYEF